MNVVFCGVRGSSPVTREGFARYGGDTTSILLEGKRGGRVLIDTGTGAGRAGTRLRTAPEHDLLLLFTHYHLDHLAGLLNLGILQDPTWKVAVNGPVLAEASPRDAVAGLLRAPYWPVVFEDIASEMTWSRLAPGEAAPVVHGDFEIRWCPLHHGVGCVAYRVTELSTQTVFIFATDVEWAASSADEQAEFLQLCRGPNPPDLLVFDGQFTAEEYPSFQGWGHSTWEEAVEIAQSVGARKLLITHHAPENDDERLAEIERAVRERMPEAGLARGEEVVRLG